MTPITFTLFWILSLLVMWAYWASRCRELQTDLDWTRGLRDRHSADADTWAKRAESLRGLLAESRAQGEEDAAQLKRRDETIMCNRILNDMLRERLAKAEQICTENLNKSFRARLPWPTVIERAFAEDEPS